MTPGERIKAAKPGERFKFAADEPLGAVSLTRTSRDLTIEGGVYDRLYLAGSGHRIIGARVQQVPADKEHKSVAISFGTGAGGAVFDGLTARGSTDSDGHPTGYGLAAVADTTIRASSLLGFWACVILNKGAGVSVDDCELGESRRSPLLGVPGHRNAFTRLRIHTLLPRDYSGSGDHGNFIGFWTAGQDVDDLLLDTITCEQRDGWPVMGVSLYCRGDRSGWWVRPVLRNICITTQHIRGLTFEQSRDAVLERLASFATRDPLGLPKPPRVQYAPRMYLTGAENPTLRDVWMERG